MHQRVKINPSSVAVYYYLLVHLIKMLLDFSKFRGEYSASETQRIYNLIRLRARVSLEAHGSTAINFYTSADCSDSQKPQPPHATCIMNRCARSCSPWSSDAWRMAEFHQRPMVKSYPLPDPGIRHRCMMSVPMCWDWKVTTNPLTRLRLPHGAAIPATTAPWTVNFQFPYTHLKLSSPRGAERFLQFTFTRHSPSTNQPPDTHQSHSPVEGSTSYKKRFKLYVSL